MGDEFIYKPQAIHKDGEKIIRDNQKKQVPFDMGINGFKKLLNQNTNLSRADKHRAVVAYKARITERLQDLAKANEKGLDNDREV